MSTALLRVAALAVLAGCQPIPSSGRVLDPVPAGPKPAPAPSTGTPAPAAQPVAGDPFADDREAAGEDRSAAPDPRDVTALLSEWAKGAHGEPAQTEPKPAPAPAPVVAALPPTPAPVWDPSRTLPDASFGVRVLGVLLDLQPPRAIIGLPDGREQVVTPGAMLPAEGLVVLAIGRDAVQVARITPAGFYARVDTETIRALYPSQTTSAP